MLRQTRDVGVEPNVTPGGREHRDCFGGNTGDAVVQGLSERFFSRFVSEEAIQDIKAVLHFAEVRHAVGVAHPETFGSDYVESGLCCCVVNEASACLARLLQE